MIALLLFILLIILPMALRRHADTWRGAILAGAIVFAGILVAITEALSAIHALSFAPVLVFWLVITIRVMGFALANKPARIPRPSLPASNNDLFRIPKCWACLCALISGSLKFLPLLANAPSNFSKQY